MKHFQKGLAVTLLLAAAVTSFLALVNVLVGA